LFQGEFTLPQPFRTGGSPRRIYRLGGVRTEPDDRLTLGVKGTCGLVEHQNRSFTTGITCSVWVEDVVVRREANERVETVRETVRETKVDVDKEPADRRVDVGGTVRPNRNS
jgi:hypothetical protein